MSNINKNIYFETPVEILDHIQSFISIYEQKSLHMINLEFFKNYNLMIDKIKKIQNFIRRNRICLKEEEDFGILTKRNIYRYYVINYDHEYFIKYPEFMANKICIDNNRRDIFRNYINENMNDIENRKRSEVVKFFKNNNISSKEIQNAGW